VRPAPAPDEASGESVQQMRRALGRQLAALRNRAGLSQWDLAPLTGYSRSTLSDAELGRHRLRRQFWVRCDELLKAENRLVASYDQIESAGAMLQQRSGAPAPRLQAVQPVQPLQPVQPIQPVQPVQPVPPEPPPDSRPDPVAADRGSRVAVESCPHCRRPIAVLLVPNPR
jgi:DNA-binding XRE family transcriptional regulator